MSMHRPSETAARPLAGFILLWVLSTLGLWVASYVFDGVHFGGPGALWVSGLLLGLANTVIRPVLILFTLPLTVLTLGVFILVINGMMVLLVAWLVPGFAVDGFWTGVFAALFLSIFNTMVNLVIGRYAFVARFD